MTLHDTPAPACFPPPPSTLPLSQCLPQSRGSDCILEGHNTTSGGYHGVVSRETVTSTPSSTSTSVSERRSKRLMSSVSQRPCNTPLQTSPCLPLGDTNGMSKMIVEVQTSSTIKKRKRRLLDLYDSSSATDSLRSPPSPTPSPTTFPIPTTSPPSLASHHASPTLLHSNPLLPTPSSQELCSSFEPSVSIPSRSNTDLPLSPIVSATQNTTTSSSSSSSSFSSSVHDSIVDLSVHKSFEEIPVMIPESNTQSTDLRSLCCPIASVCEYVKAVCRAVFPLKSVWGTRHNLCAFLSAIDR